jgi:hypothetical protein
MIKYEKIVKEQEVPIAYICDICKKEFTDRMNTQEFTHIRFTAGYNSAFSDSVDYECDICSKCLKEKLGEWIRDANAF